MKTVFSLGWQELAGLAVFGGTVGAVLCGAGAGASELKVIAGGLSGAALLPALVQLPKQKKVFWSFFSKKDYFLP